MDTALRICPFCEATCGLTLTIDDGRVTAARGDHDDVFSAGFICPKGASFGELDNDPDRLTRPLVRRDQFPENGKRSPRRMPISFASPPRRKRRFSTSA